MNRISRDQGFRAWLWHADSWVGQLAAPKLETNHWDQACYSAVLLILSLDNLDLHLHPQFDHAVGWDLEERHG